MPLGMSTPLASNPVGARLVRQYLRFTRRFKAATAGTIFLLLMILSSIFAPVLTPYSPTKPNVPERFKSPSLQHLLGTDDLGRDLTARILYGARPTLTAGALSVFLALLAGSAIGIIAAYRGGWLDNILMRLMDIMLSFPAILLAILIVTSLRPSLFNLIVAISFSMVPSFARLTRSVVLVIMQQEHITAARAIGSSDTQIIFNHVIPNTVPLIFVQATASLAVAISTAAALNYLGLGIEPPQADWGLMVSEGQKHVFSAAYIPLIPGAFITVTVLSLNFIGDALRDHLDPVLRR